MTPKTLLLSEAGFNLRYAPEATSNLSPQLGEQNIAALATSQKQLPSGYLTPAGFLPELVVGQVQPTEID